MEKMEATIMGCLGTTRMIDSFIPSQPKASASSKAAWIQLFSAPETPNVPKTRALQPELKIQISYPRAPVT